MMLGTHGVGGYEISFERLERLRRVRAEEDLRAALVRKARAEQLARRAEKRRERELAGQAPPEEDLAPRWASPDAREAARELVRRAREQNEELMQRKADMEAKQWARHEAALARERQEREQQTEERERREILRQQAREQASALGRRQQRPQQQQQQQHDLVPEEEFVAEPAALPWTATSAGSPASSSGASMARLLDEQQRSLREQQWRQQQQQSPPEVGPVQQYLQRKQQRQNDDVASAERARGGEYPVLPTTRHDPQAGGSVSDTFTISWVTGEEREEEEEESTQQPSPGTAPQEEVTVHESVALHFSPTPDERGDSEDSTEDTGKRNTDRDSGCGPDEFPLDSGSDAENRSQDTNVPGSTKATLQDAFKQRMAEFDQRSRERRRGVEDNRAVRAERRAQEAAAAARASKRRAASDAKRRNTARKPQNPLGPQKNRGRAVRQQQFFVVA